MATDKLLLEDIRSKIDLRDLALQKPELKGRRTGRIVVASCPWHTDTHPSLTFYEDGFHCFQCKESGDIFTWLMADQGIEFTEAVQTAAALAGVTIDDEFRGQVKKAAHERKRIVDFVDASQDALWEDDGGNALEHLREERGLEDATILEFRLGLDRDAQGIVLPMFDVRGVPQAYSLRLRKPAEGQGKYWKKNTASFKYSHHLYNEAVLWQESGTIYVAEGPFDVMKLHQVGLRRSVGMEGGKLSETQIRRLADRGQTLVLVPDTGGEDDWKKLQENVRALRLNAPELELFVAVPPGDDAGDSDDDELREAMKQRRAPELVLLELVLQGEMAEQYAKAKVYVDAITDPLIREDVINALSERWGKSVTVIQQSLVTKGAAEVVASSTIIDAVEKLRARTIAVAESKLKFFMPGLERYTETIQPGHSVGIAAHTNVGKSITALNCLREMVGGDYLHVFFSMEQPQAEVANRLMIMEGWANQIPLDNRRLKQILLEGGDDYEALKSLVGAKLQNLRIIDVPMSVEEMTATLQAIASTSSLPLGVVWVDHLGMLRTKGNSRYEKTSDAIVGLHHLAGIFDVILCCLIQLSRSGKGQSRKPDIEGPRDSGVIEETLDLIVGLDLGEIDDSGLCQTMDAEVLKNRHGPLGGAKWMFRKDSLLIRQIDDTMFEQ